MDIMNSIRLQYTYIMEKYFSYPRL